MAALEPRTFFVITMRGEVGPLTRDELREQARDGAVRPDDKVRNAFGRSLGSVASIMNDLTSGRTSVTGLSPVRDPPPRRTPAPRSPLPLVIALFASALVLVVAMILGRTTPIVTPAEPVPPPTAPAVSKTTAKPAPRVNSGGLPDGWILFDVGGSRPKGRVTHDTGTWTLDGGGLDFWNTADEGAHLQRPITSDFTASVRLMAISLVDEDRPIKAGLLLRVDNQPEAAMASVIRLANGSLSFQRREQRAATAMTDPGPTAGLPVWLRLQRRNGEFTAAWSPDGTTWNALGEPRTLPALAGPGMLGLAVCSYSREVTGRAVFDHLTVATAP